jgi:cytochrome oxidase Cu insertion factor (SCO1/SenC/PrrC family)
MNILFLRRCCIAVFFIALAACSPKPDFKNIDITGSTAFGKEFSLLDPDGNVKTLADFKGKVVVMFFGYTQCPDICPTTLTEMQQVMTLLLSSSSARKLSSSRGMFTDPGIWPDANSPADLTSTTTAPSVTIFL